VLQLGDVLGQALAHGPPIRNGHAHLVQDALDGAAQHFQLRPRGLLVDLDVHRRLDDGVERRGLRRGHLDAAPGLVAAHAHDGVEQEVDGALAPVDLHADGVDQERHVIVDDLDDGVLERPAVLLGGRVEDAHFRFAGRALPAELPQRQSAAEEGLQGGVDDVVGSDEGEVTAEELVDALGLARADAPTRLGHQPLDEIRLALLGCKCHAAGNHIPRIARGCDDGSCMICVKYR
jgi:hypothetical protein